MTFSIAESGACVQKLLRNMNFIVGGASTIRGGKKMRGRYGTEHGQQFKGETAKEGWASADFCILCSEARQRT